MNAPGSEPHGFWARITRRLDSDSVRQFIPLYYLPLIAYGLFCVPFPKATSIMDGTLGLFGSRLWVAACITMSTVALVGLALRHGGMALADMTKPLLRQDYLGLFMQAAGHAAMSLVLLALEIAALRNQYVWYLVPFVFAIASYVLGTALLTAQCARKIQKGHQLEAAR